MSGLNFSLISAVSKGYAQTAPVAGSGQMPVVTLSTDQLMSVGVGPTKIIIPWERNACPNIESSLQEEVRVGSSDYAPPKGNLFNEEYFQIGGQVRNANGDLTSFVLTVKSVVPKGQYKLVLNCSDTTTFLFEVK